MAFRKQRATTTKEIMDQDISKVIKKAKTRFRNQEEFYILKYTIADKETYFASGFPDIDTRTGEAVYYQRWYFDNENKKWLIDL